MAARLLGHSDLKMLTKICDHTSTETLRQALLLLRKQDVPAKKKPLCKAVSFLLSRETTGSAGGGAPQKSFSFKRRAKRATNSKLTEMEGYR